VLTPICIPSCTGFVTPFEVGIGLPTNIDALFVINQVVNVIFVIDIGIQFLMPVPNKTTGEMIRSHTALAANYLRGWFPLDLISVLPIDIVVVASPNVIPEGNSSLVRTIRLLRVMRLFKLIRVLRASRIIQRWENNVALSTSARSIVAAWLGFIVVVHWLACFWALVPQLVNSWRDVGHTLRPTLASRMAVAVVSNPQCTGCSASGANLTDAFTWQCGTPCLTACERLEIAQATGTSLEHVYQTQNWRCRATETGMLDTDYQEDHFRVWCLSILIALIQMAGGVGILEAKNVPEFMCYSLAILVGTVLFATVQGIIVQVLTTGNPDETLFRQQLDALNYMMEDNRVDKESRVRVREYFRRSKSLQKRRSYVTLIDTTLSDELRGDVRYLVSHTLFDSIWYLAACERAFLEDLSPYVTRQGYSIGERVETKSDWLQILVQGVCSRSGSILTAGFSWGDIIVSSPMLRDTRHAKSLSYCEIARVPRSAILSVGANYPKSAAYLRYAGLMLATKRSLMIASLVANVLDKDAQLNASRKRAVVDGDKGEQLSFGVRRAPVNPSIRLNSILNAIHGSDVSSFKSSKAGSFKTSKAVSFKTSEAPEVLHRPTSVTEGELIGDDVNLSGTSSDALARQVASLTKAIEASEARRTADARETLVRIAKLEALWAKRFRSRRNMLGGEDVGSASTGRPPSRRRELNRTPEAETPYEA
jgi:hypothetical protein